MNGTTALILGTAGVVQWEYAPIMAATGIVGGYVGARVARRIPADYVRVIVVSIGFLVAAYSWMSSRA
jgi:uncharacterized protein